MIIIIHYDYTDGTEISYEEGLELLEKNIAFTTHNFEFFNHIYLDECIDVIVVKKNKDRISLLELFSNNGFYTDKEIRKEHNVRKMLVAGSFNFKPH